MSLPYQEKHNISLKETYKVELRRIYYYRVQEDWRRTEKLDFIKDKHSIASIEWQELLPDERHTWITEGLKPEFLRFLSLGSKATKSARNIYVEAIFKTYSLGVHSSRDSTVYDFNQQNLINKVKLFIEDYNSEIARWVRSGRSSDIDNFVSYDKVKWSRNLKRNLRNERYAHFNGNAVHVALYRPFTRMYLYLADILVDEEGTSHSFFPTIDTENENTAIVVSDHGHRASFSAFATNAIADLHLLATSDVFQTFPFYTYAEDGSNRRENITDWALAQFQEQYGSEVTKWDIFHYVYAMLHHPVYRERYAENLKHDLPRIPLLTRREAFVSCVDIGKALMELHLNYETVKEYRLQWVENKDESISWRVEKIKLSAGKDALRVNEWLTLAHIPQECFQYRLGNRSALEWVIDQYQVSTDARSGIVSDPNREDDEQYIVRLVGKVVTVSVETVKLVEELVQAVKQEDWMNEEEE